MRRALSADRQNLSVSHLQWVYYATTFATLCVAVAAFTLSLPVHASEASTVGTTDAQSPKGVPLPLGTFQYIPAEKWKGPDASELVARNPAQERVATLYSEGKYAEVGAEGLSLLKTEKVDDLLQLYIANSLAWTSRAKEAGQIYRVLLQGKHKMPAMVGLANVHRWQGRDHLAQPLYKEILALEPDNKEAIEGLLLANREIQPRTTVTVGGLNDSSDVKLRTLILNHRWRDSSLANIWEIETSRLDNSNTLLDVKRQDLTVRFQGLELPFKPRFELSSNGKKFFASAGVEFEAYPISLTVGRINWGELANNPRALQENLSANRLAAQGTFSTAAGYLFARAEINNISDGNSIVTSAIRFIPSWRPLGPSFKPLLGIETRDAKFSSLSYWSPSEGYGTVFAGLLGEWESRDWNFYASAQIGRRLFGEAGDSWSTSVGGKRWINNEVAVGVKFWAMASIRDLQSYRARSLYLSVDKLWK